MNNDRLHRRLTAGGATSVRVAPTASRRLGVGGTLLLCLIATVGCGQQGPATYPVEGTVTFDGEPITEGDILFIPDDSTLAPEGGMIKAGRYHMRAKAGVNRVEIRALDIRPDTEWVMGSPVADQMIPAQYNNTSQLTARVTPDGENRFDFDLQRQ